MLLLGLTTVLLLLVTAALVGLSLLYGSDLIPGGFEALGVSFGGGTQAQASQTLAQAWARLTVTVDLGEGQAHTLRPEDLGITFDITATVRLAYAQARTSPAIVQMLRDRELALPASNIDPVWKFDPARADRTLQALARQTFVPPQDARVTVADGQVASTPPAMGRVLDVAASGAVLESDAWSVITRGRFQPLFAAVAPPITDTTALIAQVQPWLSAPVAIHLYDPVADEKHDWQITPQTIGNWIKIAAKPDNPSRLQAELDETQLEAYLGEQARNLGGQRSIDLTKAGPAVAASLQGKHEQVNLRIYHAGQQYTIQSGDTVSSIADKYGIPYPWIQKANPGVGDAIRPGQVIKIPSVDGLIPLTPVENKRIVVSIKDQKMWAYENGRLKWQWMASTGMSFSPTAPGIFQIQNHEKNAYAGNWDLWMPYFMGVYRPVPDVDFMNGFHGFPSRAGTQILWTNDLGHPITYGCILLSTENATALYNWAPEGVIVEIRR